ncbi:hypothetical protein ABZS86_09310 [Streptomyces sp. NPDC005355]|uniref:hypothetical protein n=1 Tax=Streptomyces sp. NPDC005355 TaxID=3157038 RepID=UPI0033BA8B57
MRRHGAAALMALAALAPLAGCGSSDGDSTDKPTGDETTAAARDMGPLCVGKAPADGLHVLHGGGFKLPGGGGVQYEEGQGDGTTRTASLREGETYQAGQKTRTVKPGQQTTLSGHVYTVSQICSYRVVLEPKDPKDRAKAAAAPKSIKPVGGKADDGLCFTTNAAVRAAASKGFPPKGDDWVLINNNGKQDLPTGVSAAVYAVDNAAKTATIRAVCAGVQVVSFTDAAVGDTIEVAGVTFKVSKVTEKAVRLTRTAA